MQLEIWPPWCWLVWSVSWALKWSCLPLSPIVSGCLPLCGGWVLVGVAAFLGSEVVLSPVVSGCLPSCGGWVLVGVAASRTKIFRNQNHRFQSKFAYCKLFGVYAGVITFDPSVWLRLSRCLNQLNIWWWKKDVGISPLQWPTSQCPWSAAKSKGAGDGMDAWHPSSSLGEQVIPFLGRQE